MTRSKVTSQSGQALLAAAFGLVAFIGATGLAIDMGYLRYAKRLQQSAADSAAIAGAAELNSGNWDSAAKQDSSLNGFTDGKNKVVVTVTNPTFNGQSAVKVQVSAVQSTFFMRIFGVNSATLSATATAILGQNGLGNCLYVLGRNAGGVTTNGTARIDAPNCAIVDNDDMTQNGSGSITAASIGVAGSVKGSNISPKPAGPMIPAADPLSFLSAPAAGGGCKALKVSNPPQGGGGNGGGGNNGPGPGGASPVNVLASDGPFCSIDVTGSKDVIFHPGTYVIKGNFTLNGSGTVTGDGVTFYVTNGGQVSFSGNQTIQFTAPTAGTYAGILFFQDSADASSAKLDGANNSKFQGTLYFPNAPLTINGNAGSTAAYMIVVAKSLTLNGAGLSLPADYSSLPRGLSPIKNAVLVE
jgi:hypothetical protein